MRISVIIPTHNRASLLVRTLDSVFAQTRSAEEVIVVDDGSTDNTRNVVAGYPRPVNYQYQMNARPGAARNRGYAVSGGDALLFLDSDDLLKPTALGRLERALTGAPDAALAYCACDFIGSDGEPRPPLEGHQFRSGDVWSDLARGNFIRSPGSALIRRSHLERAGPWLTWSEIGVNEDWELFLRLAETAPFAFVAEPLFSYRVQDGSLGSNEMENYRWALVILERHINRHAGDDKRLMVLARQYDVFYEATVARWKRAAVKEAGSGSWRAALRRVTFLARARSRRVTIQRLLAPYHGADGLITAARADEV